MFKRLLRFVCGICATPLLAGQIALTFDDSPRLPSPLFGAAKRSEKIRNILKEHEVTQALFLATPSQLNSATKKILSAHGNAGHLIGNHTHSHMSANEESSEKFIADFRVAHEFLKEIPGFDFFFRFPFLREGSSQKDRHELATAYKALGYQNAYVTIDTSDWVLEHELLRAIQLKKKINYDALKEVFVASLVDGADFYSTVARKSLGRDMPHVLLLHENEVNALFLGDLLAALKTKGWEFISPRQAYSDPIAKIEPRTMVLNQGRVMALAIDAGYTGNIRAPLEEVDALKKLLTDRKVFSSP